MTTQELIDYYSNLLIMQYRGSLRAHAHVQLLADSAIMDQLPLNIQGAFNIETAIGAQLDVLGLYQGASRTSFYGGDRIVLGDSDYRLLIKFAIIRNTFESDLSSIQTLMNQFFPDQVFVYDYEGMRVSYFIDSDFGSLDLVNSVIAQGLIPKPMGVTLSPTIYAPTIDNYFGYVSYEIQTNPAISPLNTYESYDMTSPWLDYDDAL